MSRKSKPAWCEDLTGGAFATQPPVLTMKVVGDITIDAIYEAMEQTLAGRPDSWLWQTSDEIVLQRRDVLISGGVKPHLWGGLNPYVEVTMVARLKSEIQDLVDNPLEKRVSRVVDLCE